LEYFVNKFVSTLKSLEESLFLLSPSFYAMISGAIIGAAINLLTSLIFVSNVKIDVTLVKFGIVAIFISAICIGKISFILEEIRSRITNVDDENTRKYRLIQLTLGERKKLWLSIEGALITIIVGMIFIGSSI